MGGFLPIIIFSCHMLLISNYVSSLPLCTNLRAPFTPKASLTFCQYNGSVCCNSTEDLELQNQFKAMNVSAVGCSSLLKSILCSRCDPFSAELYRIESEPRIVPILCNSTVSANSSQSQLAGTGFCSKVWDECQNVSISQSPFSQEGKSGTARNSFNLTDSWKSQVAFCDEFGGASDDGSVCFPGGPVSLQSNASLSLPNGMCVEKIGNGSYLNMVPHPDGSNRAFFANQRGMIWLATVPEEGSGETLSVDESNTFLDLSDQVYSDAQFGLLGIAFHPNFQQNGRFFASFNCDKVRWPECSGRCSCNTDVGCDPSKLVGNDGSQPCRYHSVIAEFTANGSTSLQPGSITRAQPQEVRRIFTMGLPFTSHHGGQILFGPADGYLYFMMGDGGHEGDPYNFSQNKKSLLGKILRLDVDNTPGANVIKELGLWGNYSVPADNPFSEDEDLQPEIWALGFRNPWRCSFDAERSSYFLCADVGQDQYEEVDIVTKGGNYGWRVYEGPFLYNPPSSPGRNASARSINLIFPVMGYNHSEVNEVEGSASIAGGYFLRSTTDPCLYGSYVYADLYADAMWAGTETPKGSGNFTTTKLAISCARDSPIPCTSEEAAGSPSPAMGFIFSFGQDNRKDMFVLSSNGVYRIARPSRCNFTCSKENSTAHTRTQSAPSPPSSGERVHNAFAYFILHFVLLLLIFL